MLLAAVKILGIILLILLSAAVLALAVILFTPIRYETKGGFKGEPDFSYSLSWLFGAIKIKGSFNNNGINNTITYPFKKLKDTFNKKRKQKKKKKPKPPQKKAAAKTASQPKTQTGSSYKTQQTKTSQKAKQKTESKQKRQGFLSRTADNIKTIADIENKRDIISCLVKNIIYIFKKQKTKVFSLNILFGFDDPSLTGKVLGVLYASTFALIKGTDIHPDFEKAVFEADLDIKGRGNLFYIAVTAVKILLNKNVRSLIFKEV